MKLTKEDVLRTAKLAKLKIADEEIASSKIDLQEFLTFSKQLDELDTSNVEPTVSTFTYKNVLREDKVSDSLEKTEVLKNAPSHNENTFIVPRVVE